MRILIVDDSQTERVAMSARLQTKHLVWTASSIAEAAEIASDREFDVLLIDVRMPPVLMLDALRLINQIGEVKTTFMSSDNADMEFFVEHKDTVIAELLKPTQSNLRRHLEIQHTQKLTDKLNDIICGVNECKVRLRQAKKAKAIA